MKFKIWNSRVSDWVICSHRRARIYAVGGRMIGPFNKLNEVLFDKVNKGLTNNIINKRLSLYKIVI
jgi:hypothetical protein